MDPYEALGIDPSFDGDLRVVRNRLAHPRYLGFAWPAVAIGTGNPPSSVMPCPKPTILSAICPWS